MKIRVTLAEPFLRAIQAELAAHPERVLRHEAGLRRKGNELELLLPTRLPAGPDTVSARIFRLPRHLRGVSHLYWAIHERRTHTRPVLDLALLEGQGCSAALLDGDAVHPIEDVRPAGRWMEHWTPALAVAERTGDVPPNGAFSRYIGALGGAAIHARLCSLSVALVGAARLGSGLAAALVRAGVGRLILIDPDRLEEHSLDAADCLPEDVGRPKVEAVAAFCARLAPGRSIATFATRVEAPEAFAACAESDLIVSAPDDNHARLAAALAASAYLRPHIDVGSGVFGRGDREAGADVRLIIPGQGCLLCLGGLDLARRPTDWRRQRAGSLRSLNQIAIGQAMTLLEGLVAGELEQTTWMRLTLARGGALATQAMGADLNPDCTLCGRRLGLGDAVLRDLSLQSIR